jgi:hypothetical protein
MTSPLRPLFRPPSERKLRQLAVPPCTRDKMGIEPPIEVECEADERS